MSLYLTLELCVLAVPLILSFDKKVAFYKQWKRLFPALLISSIIFIGADIVFTRHGIWGFNPKYHICLLAGGIPVEEWLFFLIIPYASIFTHYVIISYFPNAWLAQKTTRIISMILITVLSVMIILFHNRTYTTFYSAFMAGLLVLSFFTGEQILNRFYITYLVILAPFFIVNGILTGSFIQEEVVWYNNAEITGFRIFTVPVEDIMYGFSLIYLTLFLMDKFHCIPGNKTYIKNEQD